MSTRHLAPKTRKRSIQHLPINFQKTRNNPIKSQNALKGLVNKRDKLGLNGLDYAVYDNDSEAVQKFIKVGVNVNNIDNNDMSSLYKAVWYGNMDIIKLLIKNGAKLNVGFEYYPLVFASISNEKISQRKRAKITKYLIKKGLNVNMHVINHNRTYTALDYVVDQKLEHIQKKLTKYGAISGKFIQNKNINKNLGQQYPLDFVGPMEFSPKLM